MKPKDFLKGGEVHIWREVFAVVKSKKPNDDAFANIVDKKETTVIIEQNKVKKEDIIEIESEWRLLTFDMTLPFELVGFMAAVSGALAEEGVSIFVVSAYSTDHVLVKDEDLESAIEVMKKLGCKVVMH